MIKGVLVEKKRNYAIVLTKQGEFIKTKPVSGQEIGEEATVTPIEQGQASSSVWKKLSSGMALRVSTVLALILILLIPFYGWFGPSNDTYAYVSIDINPSIELAVNESYQVVQAVGLNEDGERVLSDLSWQEESIVDLSQTIIEKSDQLGYIQQNQQVLIGISYLGEKKDTEVLDQISDKIHHYRDNMEVALMEIPEDIRKQAQEFHQSMNLTYATEQLSEVYEDDESEEVSVEKDQGSDSEVSESPQMDQRHKEILRRFIENSNRDNLPPGLLKKLKEDGKLPPGLQKRIDEQEEQQGDSENSSDGSSDQKEEETSPEDSADQSEEHPSNNGEGHPSNQRRDKPHKDDEDHPSHKDEDHPSNKGEDHPSHKDNDHPSHKDKDHPSNQDDDHPGHGPPTGDEDHPLNKSDDHPSNKGSDNHPSEKDDDHPSNKDDDHPSSNQGPPSL